MLGYNELHKINEYLKEQLWMDFEICNVDRGKLELHGFLDEGNDSNANSSYIMQIINDLTLSQNECYWVVADLELVPVFHGDHSGTGGEQEEGKAYSLSKRLESNKVEILDYIQLIEILKDTLTIRNMVLACFDLSYKVDLDSFQPKVEFERKKLFDSHAKYEIRILDGSLITVIIE